MMQHYLKTFEKEKNSAVHFPTFRNKTPNNYVVWGICSGSLSGSIISMIILIITSMINIMISTSILLVLLCIYLYYY
jgi:hypothetical protein